MEMREIKFEADKQHLAELGDWLEARDYSPTDAIPFLALMIVYLVHYVGRDRGPEHLAKGIKLVQAMVKDLSKAVTEERAQ
jgi:hypothetical protein